LLRKAEIIFENENTHEKMLNALGGAFLFIKKERITTYADAYFILQTAYVEANIASTRLQTKVERTVR